MKLKELSNEAFSLYAKEHEQNNFHQTIAWGELKETNGWHNYYVGLVDENDKILGATLLLSKKIIGKLNMFYAPRGFLIDYHNFDLLKKFTSEIKKYVKKKGAIFIKIDPYVMYKERDINGDIVEDGTDNSVVLDNLKQLGYKHKGLNIYQGTLQPRWMFVLDVAGKTEDQLLKEIYHQTTRHAIKRTLKSNYEIVEIKLEDMDQFKDIMAKTSERRGFVDRPLSYYQNMYKILGKYDMLKVLLVKFNCDNSINILEEDKKEKEAQRERIASKLISSPDNIRFINQVKELDNNLNDRASKIEEIKQLKEQHGNVITMSGSMFVTYGDEVLYLFSGSYEEFMKYEAPYAHQWEMIRYAANNGYKRYNFYGISGSFDKSDESYGVYSFKKGFNGKVIELVGEFDLVINKFYFNLYNISYKVYRNLKNIRTKK